MSPARGPDGRFIGRGFIEVVLQDKTDDDLAKLRAKLSKVRPVEVPITADGRQATREFDRVMSDLGRGAKPVTVPVGVKVSGQRDVDALRRQLDATAASSEKVTAAQNREADAAGRVRVAEVALQEAQARAGVTAEQLVAAEEKLAAAKRGHEQASRSVVTVLDREQASLARVLATQKEIRKDSVIPVGVKVSPQAGPELTRLREQLRALQAASHVKPTYEAREFTDAYGKTYTRYIKVSKDAGTFAGEGLGAAMYKGVAAMMLQPGLAGPVAAGIAAIYTSTAFLQVPARFAKLAVDIQSSNAPVSESFFRLRKDIDDALQVDTAVLAGPLIRSAGDIGRSFDGLRPQMRDVFSALPPQIDQLTRGVTAFATNAMPGLVRAVDAADPVVIGLADGMASAGTGVTRFYDALISSAPEAGQSFRTLGVIVGDVAELAGRTGAAVVEAFGGQLWNEAEGVVDGLSRVVGNFATSALPPFATGLEVAGRTAELALGIIEPFSGVIGTAAGTILGATVVVRGFSAALGLIASARVLTTLAPMKAGFATLATQITTSGVAASGWTQKMTGSAAAGEKVAGVSNKIAAGLRGVGNQLPVIGAALVAGAVAYEEFGSKADDAASRVVAGTTTMAQAINDERNQLEKRSALWGAWSLAQDQSVAGAERQAAATANVSAAVKEQEASMGLLERAESRVARARAEYDAALAQHGTNSAQAKAAAAELGAAQQDLAVKQHEAERAAKDHTQALVDQTNIMKGSVDAEFAYADAQQRAAEASQAAADAIRQHGAGSKEASEAVDDLARANAAQATAAERAAQAAYAGADENTRATKSAEAYRTELLRTADVSSGPGRAAFAQIAGAMDNASLSALSATASASGLRTEIITLPDGRTVTVVVGADRAKLDQLNDDFRQLDGKVATVTVAGQTVPFQTALTSALAAVAAAKPVVDINGNPVPLRDVLGAILGQVNSAKGTMSIDGNPTLANGKTTAAVRFADGSKGTVTIDGNQTPVNGKITAQVKYANGSTGVIQLDANPAQFNGKVAGARSTAAGTVAWIPVNADTSRATGQLRALWTTWNGRTINVNIGGSRITAGGGVFGYAGGGVMGTTPGFAGGGMVRRASKNRGMVIPGYAPGVDTEPTLMSKGEAVLVPELVRQLGASRILAANAEASGGRPATVVGQVASLMDGVIGGQRDVLQTQIAGLGSTLRGVDSPAGSTPVRAPAATPAAVGAVAAPAAPAATTIVNSPVYNVTVQVDGRLDLNNPIDARRLGARLTEILRDHDRGTR